MQNGRDEPKRDQAEFTCGQVAQSDPDTVNGTILEDSFYARKSADGIVVDDTRQLATGRYPPELAP